MKIDFQTQKNPVPKSLAKINPLIHLAIYCTQAKCPECDHSVRTIESKESQTRRLGNKH
jgi:hypothetical protein